MNTPDTLPLCFWLNGQVQSIPQEPYLLLDFLRDYRHLTASKGACREGECGSCLVLVCDQPAIMPQQYRAQTSCLLRVQDLVGQHVITAEALRSEFHCLNLLHLIMADAGASQCGFCSPGLVIGVVNWLLNGPELTVTEGEDWLNANLCRCTGYMGQRRSIETLIERLGDKLRCSDMRLQVLIEQGILPSYAAFVFSHPAQIRVVQRDDTQEMVLGGGTDLYLHRALDELPAHNVLAQSNDPVIRLSHDGFAVNARQPIQRIAEVLQQHGLLPSFARFNHLFASLSIRNRATLGGNLAHASPVADSAPYLMALDARIQTTQRVIAMTDFFTGFKKTSLNPGEIIEWIQVPLPNESDFVHFDKVSRRGTTDIASVNCAGFWRIHNQRIDTVRLVLGGATSVPVRLLALEHALMGQNLSISLRPLLQTHLQDCIAPVSDVRGSAAYRRLLAQQLLLAQWEALIMHVKAGMG